MLPIVNGHLRQLALAVLAVAGLGCSFDWAALDPRESGSGGTTAGTGGPATGQGGGTPSGTSAGTATGSPTGTATGNGGAGTGVDPDCLIALEDTFDVLDDALWSTQNVGNGCDVTNPGGDLRFSCAADPSPRQVGLTSVDRYDLSACGVHVELESLSLNGDAEVDFAVVLETTSVGFVLEGLSLSARVTSPELNVNVTHGFNPIADKWWRVRGQRGCTIWETSPDASDWNTFHEECDMTLSDMRVALRLEVSDPMSAVSVELDNVNLF